MADKIQNAYHESKNIYDDVLTQGNIFSKLYNRLFWSGTDDNEIARKVLKTGGRFIACFYNREGAFGQQEIPSSLTL